jgi:hypothetical protein
MTQHQIGEIPGVETAGTLLGYDILISVANMVEHRIQSQRPVITQEELKKKLEVSHFDPNAVLRGAQLTVVGGKH